MSKNRMISNELMMALIKYHVLDMKDNEEINNLIISELEEKLSKMSRHEDYTKSKMAPTKKRGKSTDRNILKPLECTGTLDGSNSLQHK